MTAPKEVLLAIRVALEHRLKNLEGLVTDALAYAGCPHPKEMAKYFIPAQANGGNGDEAQTIRALLGHPDHIPSSTVTNRIKKIDWRKFMNYVNEMFAQAAQEAVKRRPPDKGRVHLPVDPHYEDYRPRSAKEGEAFNAGAKASYSVYNPKQNKTSDRAIAYLVVGVTWQHAGERISRPLRVELLTPLQASSHEHHCRVIHAAAKRLGYRVGSVILDSWYDASSVRHRLRSLGYTALHRMRFGAGSRISIWIDGNKRSLTKIAQQVLHDPGIRPQQVHRWGPDRQPTRFLVKQRILRGHLGSDPPWKRSPQDRLASLVQLQVAIATGPAGPCIDWDRTSAIVLHSSVDRVKSEFIYHVRWTVETLFQVLENSQPTHKEQLITREVVNFLTLFLLVTALTDLRTTLEDLYPGHRIADRRIRNVAIRTWINGGLIMRYFQ